VRRVILILTDGLRPDAISTGLTPWLDALSREYCAAPEAVTVRPSTTVAALTSLVTGVAPTTHRFTSPGLGFIGQLQPMRTVARELARHGLSTRVVAGEIELVQHATVMALAAAAGIPRITCAGSTAREVASAACRDAENRGSGVTFVYLNDCDLAGHRDGWMSSSYLAAAAAVDDAVGALTILAGDSLVIVVSDHGGGGVSADDHREPHPTNDRIPLILAGPGVARRRRLDGPVSLLDVPPTLLHWLGVPVPASYEGRVLADAFDPRARAAVIAA
jgi:predicted AlkP superfamily pyrophosphatase or phosphodiesterase